MVKQDAVKLGTDDDPRNGALALARAHEFRDQPAVVDSRGSYSYAELLAAADRVASGLLHDVEDLAGARVAFAIPPGLGWMATLWGIWRAGGIAVPLCLTHPLPEQLHVTTDSGTTQLVFDRSLMQRGKELAEASGARLHNVENLLASKSRSSYPLVPADEGALIIYSSGTTGRPKGAISTHRVVAAQIESLVDAWKFTPEDRSLLVLPLHHLHGVIVVVGCTLWAGGCCEMLPKFEPQETWERLASGAITIFMGVPTLYAKLSDAWGELPSLERLRLGRAAARLRFMACGSAALSRTLQERWLRITGHVLLERYGATETGIVLSNPLEGDRRLGYVGQPLGGVSLRLVDESGAEVAPGTPGEVEVRGSTLFSGYWQQPETTEAAFRDGWYRTGDLAVVEEGFYRILGRKSVDIIKSGGFKISALEIEGVLLEHPAIEECAVVGLEDDQWGERVAVAAVLRAGERLDQEMLRAWGQERLASYKVPRVVLLVARLPRNAMGKVMKPQVKKLFEGTDI